MMEKHMKTNTKVNKKKFIVLFIIVLLVIISMGIAIIGNVVINKDEQNVKNTINSAFKSLVEGNIEESKKYLDYNSLISILDKEILTEENLLKYELNKELFSSLEWTIKEINIQENTIEVAIEILNKDYSEIIIKWLELIIEEEKNGNTLTNDQCTEKMKEAILNDEIEKVTETREITLVNNEGNLEIIVNNELGNALFPRIEKINDFLSEAEQKEI